jgi:hypothetical protein
MVSDTAWPIVRAARVSSARLLDMKAEASKLFGVQFFGLVQTWVTGRDELGTA